MPDPCMRARPAAKAALRGRSPEIMLALPQDGRQPASEDFLRQVAATERAPLLRELIQIELWWRRNESPRPAPAS